MCVCVYLCVYEFVCGINGGGLNILKLLIESIINFDKINIKISQVHIKLQIITHTVKNEPHYLTIEINLFPVGERSEITKPRHFHLRIN